MGSSPIYAAAFAVSLLTVCNAMAVDVTDHAEMVAAYGAHTGLDVAAEDLCIVTNSKFAGVAVTGLFAHDRGCMVSLVLVDDAWLAPGAASSPALLQQGWREADAAARADMAWTWTEFAIFPFQGILRTENQDFLRGDAPEFVAPSSVAAAGGGVIVTTWVIEPSGMLCETEYKLWELTFDRDGTQVRTRVLDDYLVAC